MTDKYIIECPSCKVRFFVTDDLLSAAGGALRCGFCKHVFNGNDYIVYQTLRSVTEPVESTIEQASTNHQQKASQPEKTQQAKTDHADDYWNKVVDTLTTFSVDFKSVNESAVEASEFNFASEELATQQSLFTAEEVSTNKTYIDADIVAALDKIDFDELLQLDDAELIAKQSKDITTVLTNINASSLETVNSQQALVLEEESSALDEKHQLIIEDGVATDIYGNRLKKVSDVDFSIPSQSKSKIVNKHTLLWTILTLLAVLVLLGQYLRYAAPEMSKIEANRAWAEQVCSYLWCDIPDLVDVQKIITSQLLVRSNPQHDGVLNVDAIIRNDLTVFQPFPVIELRFTDLNGQIVASRRFSPDEYLSHETLKKNKMPPQTPIYISFEIIDPGEEAVGHSLYYYPAVQSN
ncbi:DUF3426 domain-containing protein [Entomomonas asaccharolytica]|uniref:DUF3426 domain-containing protein n=1 Tax=Entomomonas asaccharolytica TaxID=2785331 RepID=A0A974RYE8_9GAMM|nr:DUF3426 domain-containing protein [Entomomonas asaccharolytica]QQP87185.1 DUF3426 domain-containing protein [Entomomonas asaccharolytica]